MPVPQGYTLFSWTRAVCGRLNRKTEESRVIYEALWPSLGAGIKTAVKNTAVAEIDLAIAELQDIKASVQAL